MENLADLEQAADALVVVTQIFVDAHPVHPIDGVLAVLSSTISRLEGFRTRLIGQRGITDRSALAAEFGLACAEAAQLEKAAQRLPSLGPLLRAVESGDVSMSKARMVAEVVTRTRTEEGERDGDRLTELAIELPSNQLARELELWARSIDEEQGISTNEDLRSKRSLETFTRHTAMTDIVASLDPESAETVKTAFDARVRAEWRHESSDEHARRTSTQRRADALTGICRDWLNGQGQGQGLAQRNGTVAPVTGNNGTTRTSTVRSRPHVSVIINLESLTAQNGHGVTERGVPLSAETIRRIACDAGISAIFTNSRSEIIDVGREQRTFTGATRKVLVQRDRGCRFPSCTAPPSWTDGHDIQHWANGGETTTSNGCLLCHQHHQHVHEHDWKITGDANGELTFISPTGTQLKSKPPGHRGRRA